MRGFLLFRKMILPLFCDGYIKYPGMRLQHPLSPPHLSDTSTSFICVIPTDERDAPLCCWRSLNSRHFMENLGKLFNLKRGL